MKTALHLIVILALFAGVLYVYVNHWDDINLRFFNTETVHTIYLDKQVVNVTVADTLEERKQGLSGVEGLGGNEGKLFIFDKADYHGIWMKDMLFSIDIIWIGDDLRIVHIEENISPDTYKTKQVFAPKEPARFVLETNAFFADSYNLDLGDKFNFPSEILPDDITSDLLR